MLSHVSRHTRYLGESGSYCIIHRDRQPRGNTIYWTIGFNNNQSISHVLGSYDMIQYQFQESQIPYCCHIRFCITIHTCHTIHGPACLPPSLPQGGGGGVQTPRRNTPHTHMIGSRIRYIRHRTGGTESKTEPRR